MEGEKKWKRIAIVFIIIASIETLMFAYGYIVITIEENQIKECYYNICEDYIEAELVGDICSCYDYDLIGNLIVTKEEWME